MKPNSAACSNVVPVGDPGASPLGLAARVLLAALTVYKRLISPHFAGSCRFLPSCADYARDAVIVHGAWRGSWLATKRLARCHPLCAAGYDPVPARGAVDASGEPVSASQASGGNR